MLYKGLKRPNLKRGDTRTIRYKFTEPAPGYDWSGITVDCAFTNVTAPSDNAGADAVRIAQSLVVDPDDNSAYYDFKLTPAEAMALTVDNEYHDEIQLKDGTDTVTTPVTGKTKVVQDYII